MPATLDNELKKFVAWGNENNVPLYVGEYGLYKECFLNDKGGLKWVTDLIDLFDTYGINHTYHDYHDYSFGFYYNNGLLDDSNCNFDLINFFLKKVEHFLLNS
jgi:hypothetical protein